MRLNELSMLRDKNFHYCVVCFTFCDQINQHMNDVWSAHITCALIDYCCNIQYSTKAAVIIVNLVLHTVITVLLSSWGIICGRFTVISDFIELISCICIYLTSNIFLFCCSQLEPVICAYDMAVYFDYKLPTRYPGCHDLIQWHRTYCLLAVSIHSSSTNDAAVEFYKDEVSHIISCIKILSELFVAKNCDIVRCIRFMLCH